MKKLTQERLKEILDYTPETGEFRWLVSQGNVKGGYVAGTVKENGYIQMRLSGKSYYAHRLAWLFVNGYFPESGVDHIDRNPSNNSIANLREVPQLCNARNSKISATNISGVRGVSWDKIRCAWRANIAVRGRNYNLGVYKDFIEATSHRLAAESCLDWDMMDLHTTAYMCIKKYLKELRS